MPDQPNKFYVTTPIYYVNARPHIGHAYTTIAADVLARRHRLMGEDTFFLTGTDEHGQKIERSAAAAGIPPQQFADRVSAEFETLWKRMGITHDAYIRTTDPEHACGVQKLFATLYEKGFIYLDTYTGAYCVSDEAFVDVQAGEPCPECGRITEIVTEENFFFRLSAFQLPLLNLIESGQLKIENEARRNEVLSFLRGNIPATTASNTSGLTEGNTAAAMASHTPGLAAGFSPLNSEPDENRASAPASAITAAGTPYVPDALKDISVSRSSFTWGIPVPEPAASAAKQKHVIYVWLDALANYMTAIGYGADTDPSLTQQQRDEAQAKFHHYWPADLHLVGKEIIRFHCVYWPAFLLAAELPLPKAITAHGWLLFDNSKMSKSKGNIVRTETILDAFGTLCPPPPAQPRVTSENSVILSERSESKDPEAAEPVTNAGPIPTISNLSSRSAAEGSVFPPEAPQPTKHARDLFATDVLRYFLLREIPFGQDGSFSFEALVTRYNADLANGYGNLVSRTLTMVNKYFDGSIPAINEQLASEIAHFRREQERGNFPNGFTQHLESLSSSSDFNTFLQGMNTFISGVDQNLSAFAPWKPKETDQNPDRTRRFSLYYAAESIRIITALLHPILPYATARVWAQLGLGDITAAARNGELKNLQWGDLQPGTRLGPLSPIFPRADKSLIETMIAMEQNDRPTDPLKSATTPTPAAPVPQDTTHPGAPPRSFSDTASAVAGSNAVTTRTGPTPTHTEAKPSAPFDTAAAQAPITAGQNPEGASPADASPQITIDDFAKVELRIAQVTHAERIPKADKLLRIEVSLGDVLPPRQILSGIAEHYAPEDLIGRRIIVITNLAPRKMRGLESHGMLLAASEEGGKPYLATVPEGVPLGTHLK